MASIDVKVETPAVPKYLAVQMPGRAKVMRIPISNFSEEELADVADEWRKQLFALASQNSSDDG
tara:strand:+ start:10108 stop:10299 length:192 start_codon:yes stop_codon:yes gene_type:complete